MLGTWCGQAWLSQIRVEILISSPSNLLHSNLLLFFQSTLTQLDGSLVARAHILDTQLYLIYSKPHAPFEYRYEHHHRCGSQLVICSSRGQRCKAHFCCRLLSQVRAPFFWFCSSVLQRMYSCKCACLHKRAHACMHARPHMRTRTCANSALSKTSSQCTVFRTSARNLCTWLLPTP